MFVFKFYKTYYCLSLDNIDMIWSDVYKWQSEMAFLGKIEWRCRWSRLYIVNGCIWKSMSQAWVALKADREVTTTEVDFAYRGNGALKCWLRAASGINSEPCLLVLRVCVQGTFYLNVIGCQVSFHVAVLLFRRGRGGLVSRWEVGPVKTVKR